MKKKIIIAALVFLLVSFQDVINVTANVDQAQQNIVMTQVLNHDAQKYVAENYMALLKCQLEDDEKDFTSNQLNAIKLAEPFIVYNPTIEKQDYVIYIPLYYEKEIIYVLDLSCFDNQYCLGISQEYVDWLNTVKHIQNPVVVFNYDNYIYMENQFIQQKTDIRYANETLNEEKEQTSNNFFNSSYKTKTKKICDRMKKLYIANRHLYKQNIKYMSSINLKSPQGQYGYGMCWASTAATIINHENKTSKTGFDICNQLGLGYNSGGSITDIKNALKKNGVYYNTIVKKVISWDEIKDIISSNHLAAIGGSSDSGKGHAATLCGYRTVEGKKQVRIWDSALNKDNGAYKWRNLAQGIFSTIHGTAYYWEKTLYC